ncbi:hypothetical protein BDR07DRAFT_1377903 [Suillus spraguei]|nr:hypothetical protein BDR07DRAFT_1377903 [Suillus spraguei]
MPTLGFGVYMNKECARKLARLTFKMGTGGAIGAKDTRLAAYRVFLDGKANGMIKSVGVSNYEVIRETGLEIPVVNQVEEEQHRWPGIFLSDAIGISLYSPTSLRFMPLPKSSHKCFISNGQASGWNIEPMDMANLDALDRGKQGATTWNPVDIDQGVSDQLLLKVMRLWQMSDGRCQERCAFLSNGRVFAYQLVHTLREVGLRRNIDQQTREKALPQLFHQGVMESMLDRQRNMH